MAAQCASRAILNSHSFSSRGDGDCGLKNSFVRNVTRAKGLSSSSSSLVGSSIISGSKAVSAARRSTVGAPLVVRSALKDVPKQFRQENLKDGLMENFKNVPPQLYGLTARQMDMFVGDQSPVMRKASQLDPDSITSAHAYAMGSGIPTLEAVQSGRARISMSANVSMSQATMSYGRGGGYGGYRTPPPDLPSLLLDARICYLGMPMVPEVTELIVAELLWLDFDKPNEPLYLYINSTGTQNEKRESIAFETEAYAIADTLFNIRPRIFTVNCGMAFGQAGMLLALGEKGCRQIQPNAATVLYPPKVHESSGSAKDMWLKGKELDINTQYYYELVAKGTGKSEEEIASFVTRTRYFSPQAAIDYGLADKIIQPHEVLMQRRNYEEEMLARKRTQGQGTRRAAEAPASMAGAPGGASRK